MKTKTFKRRSEMRALARRPHVIFGERFSLCARASEIQSHLIRGLKLITRSDVDAPA
jgi:hypothetical protein